MGRLIPSEEIPERVRQIMRCRADFCYFCDNYCQLLASKESGQWVPFRLWPAQRELAQAARQQRRLVLLKARQLGWTWWWAAYALWRMLFWPAQAVLIFSKRDNEAIEILGHRMRGIYERLPAWMQDGRFVQDGAHAWQLANGSRALAFPTTGGRSYTGTLVIVDEADHIPDLERLLDAVKPTVDAGGQLVLLSTPDKSQPESLFKRIYRAGKAGQGGYLPLFHGWRARPERTEAWYEQEKAAELATKGTLDHLYQEYPETDAQALAPNSLDKRIVPAWLLACFEEAPAAPARPALEPQPPALPGLVIYRHPEKGHRYVLGGDPAEGNPQSDESAACVLDAASGEEVASLAGRFEPDTFAGYLDALATYYHQAALLIERNNHGHAVLLWLREHSKLRRLFGHDGKPGWLSSGKGKALLYAAAAEAFRDGDILVHSFATYTQLASIEGATLLAPPGQADDRADACALAIQGAILLARQRPADNWRPTTLGQR
jgi:hypothetical protein